MAEDEGFVYPEEVQLQHESAITSLNALAASNGLSVDAYLANMFGSAMPAEVYEKELLNTLQYEAYVTAHADSLTYTVDKLEEAYQLSPNNYDRVSYEYLTLAWKVDSTTDADGNKVELTEEEKTATADAAEKTINELFAKYENGTALALMADEEAGIYYVQDDSAAYSSSDIASLWLFDEAREAGDCEIVTGPSAYYIVKLRERFREDYNTVNVRHVLLQPAAGTLPSDDPAYEAEQESLNADAKAKAESLLAEWKAGAATEDTFAQMAMDYSSDSSSIYGGLYSRIHQGQMVTEFEDWCFDSSRKAGDVGIVETVYGYHIMYFCGEDLPSWQALVTEDLSNEDAFAFIDSLSTGSTVERHNFGMKFVG